MPKHQTHKRPADVLVVDDHAIVSHGIEMCLESGGEFRVCGTARTSGEAMDLVTRLAPDLIVLDLMLGGRDGVELIPQFKAASPNSRIVILSSLDERKFALRCFRAGARGYLMKDERPETLIRALRTVIEGGIHASPGIRDAFLNAFVTQQIFPGDDLGVLSNGELRVFRLLGAGLTTGEAARELGISSKTVSAYRERIKNKLGISTARELEWRARKEFGASGGHLS